MAIFYQKQKNPFLLIRRSLFHFILSLPLILLINCGSSMQKSTAQSGYKSKPAQRTVVSDPTAPPPPSKQAAVYMADSQFLSQAFAVYHERYPSVGRDEYFKALDGKPTDFCLFQPNPVQECIDFGDYENDHGRKKSAMAAYQAGLLSAGYNTKLVNIRLYGALTQLCLEGNDLFNAQVYLNRIVALDSNNKWAKQKLQEILSSKYE